MKYAILRYTKKRKNSCFFEKKTHENAEKNEQRKYENNKINLIKQIMIHFIC